MEKYPNMFKFSSEYAPNISKLNELSKLMSKALEESEEKNKEKIVKDLGKVKELIKKNIAKNKSTSYVDVIITESKTSKKIEMVIEFLRFCKRALHPLSMLRMMIILIIIYFQEAYSTLILNIQIICSH